MLALAVRNTKKLVRRFVKEKNIRLGNRFTKEKNAALMAEMANVPMSETVSVLDAGAGTGILGAAIVERICKEGKGTVKFIDLLCYENCPDYLEMLADNLERVRKKCKHDYNIRLRTKSVISDFLFDEKCQTPDMKRKRDVFGGYDIAILNPPTETAEKSSPYGMRVPQMVSTSINEAYIFTALALGALKENGQLIAYLPVELATGASLSKAREYLFSHSTIERIHIFRDKPKKTDKADKEGGSDRLRSEFILKLRKTDIHPQNTVTSVSVGSEAQDVDILPPVPYDFILRKSDGLITLVKDIEDVKTFIFLASMPNTLSSIGLKARTGLTLESRYPEFIYDTPSDDRIPLIVPANIRAGHVDFSENPRYIKPVIPSLIQKNRNMLLIKRIPAKGDGRHLVCSVYLSSQQYEYNSISTHNKLNYIDYADGKREMDAYMLHGLYALFSSTLYEKYCSLVFGTSSVNVASFAYIPLPDEGVIRQIGSSLSVSRTFSSRACDNLVNSALGIRAN